jgi:6-pyruvoyltetrahydropterin/6-carboxytetrahydropterin synthase
VYTLYVDSYFWAGHSVLFPDGSAEPAHSHNFCATAKLTAPALNDKAMAMDFCSLRNLLDRITADIAGSGNIGCIDYFAKNGQTAEIMAKYIFERLKTLLPVGIALAEVIVTEEPLCRAAYAE